MKESGVQEGKLRTIWILASGFDKSSDECYALVDDPVARPEAG